MHLEVLKQEEKFDFWMLSKREKGKRKVRPMFLDTVNQQARYGTCI